MELIGTQAMLHKYDPPLLSVENAGANHLLDYY